MLRSLSLLPSRFGERDHRNDTVRAGKFEMLDPEQPNKVRMCNAAISLPTLLSLSLTHLCAAPQLQGLRITFAPGVQCMQGYTSFTIILRCDPHGPRPGGRLPATTMHDVDACSTVVTIPSSAGCPI